MTLTDTVLLATTTVDGYGDRTVTVLSEVKALFNQKLGATHVDFTDETTSQATVYLDPENQVVIDNLYRLEGMYIVSQPFDQNKQQSWYKINTITVAQRKLLNNKIDNVYCRLEKVAGLAYDPIS